MLTAAGEYYVGRCKEIETIQKEITIQMERFSSMSHGMIRIGVQPSFSDLVLKDIIPKFQESFPAPHPPAVFSTAPSALLLNTPVK